MDARNAPGGPGASPARRRRRVLGALAVLIGLGVVIAAGYLALRASRNRPLDVPLYPDAREIGRERVYDGLQRVQYVVDAPLDAVDGFYHAHEGMVCQRQYARVSERPGQEPLREGHVFTRCQLDRSWLNLTQYAIVTIRPIAGDNGEPGEATLIDIEQVWGD